MLVPLRDRSSLGSTGDARFHPQHNAQTGRTVTAAEGTAPDDWWDSIMSPANSRLPIAQLVDGLNEIAANPIPYAHLPKRAHTAFSSYLNTWGDLGTRSPDDLQADRRVATVRAMVQAAREAAAASRDAPDPATCTATGTGELLLVRLSDADRTILSSRYWTQQPLTKADVAKRLGVNATWVMRHEPKALARFVELVEDPVHSQLVHYAEDLRRRLGPYAPPRAVFAELRRLDVDPAGLPAQLLLYLAGPYRRPPGDRWFEDTSVNGRARAAHAVDAVFERSAATTTSELTVALEDLGMPRPTATNYLTAATDLRRARHIWVRWRPERVADKIEAQLLLRRAPVSSAELHALIGEGSIHTLEEALTEDDRFVRATRSTWGLRAWGMPEYRGIVDAIATVLEEAGGYMPVPEIISEVRKRYPDVAASSIKTNLSRALAFIIDKGVVRKRTEADPWPTVAPLHTVRGAFRPDRNEIRLAVYVNSEILRGSGRPFPTPVAAELGCTPGNHVVFSSQFGPVTVAWSTSTTPQTTISSVRAAAIATSAVHGDTLVLAFHRDTASVTFSRIAAGVTGLPRLRTLLGRPVRNPAAALAKSLSVRPEAVAGILYSRGDIDLEALVNPPRS